MTDAPTTTGAAPHAVAERAFSPPGTTGTTPSGIVALDERLGGGLRTGGVYLAAGPPGPAKLVAALHFLHEGVSRGQRALLLTGARVADILDLSAEWGADLRPAFADHTLDAIGFREDFEMRVLRSAEPEDAMEELASLVAPDVERIVVDPGSLLLQGRARTLLGPAFLEWARHHPATTLVTLSIDGPELPSSAEWLIRSTTGILLFDQGEDGFYQVDLRHLRADGEAAKVTLQLAAGRGLARPEAGPFRRRSDRARGHASRLLFLSLSDDRVTDLEAWAGGLFTTEVVHDAMEAVSSVQEGPGFGCILIYASRARVPDTIRTCRALRPLTGAPILVVSDDAMRSSDRAELLEAGADDSLSGGVDVRELHTRIRQAIETGGKPAPKGDRRTPERLAGGLVEGQEFEAELRARFENPWKRVLTVVRMWQGADRSEPLQRVLVEEVRSDQGDLVATAGPAYLVLLQGARRDAVHAFIDRVRRRTAAEAKETEDLRSEIFSHPGDRQGILDLMGSLDERETTAPEMGPGGTGGQEG
jgi:CheY-like chemotaxis protein